MYYRNIEDVIEAVRAVEKAALKVKERHDEASYQELDDAIFKAVRILTEYYVVSEDRLDPAALLRFFADLWEVE
ncbi:MAG: hypothetical protein DRJ38_00385 [Thermoprotei archaeon]|nr:MAG: hypothetical protein DRJ38_00385 [Thermoprotei archaeon]